jgi:hypothetical protein
VADIEPKALRERCEKRLGSMKAQRLPWEGHWRDIASFCQPMRGRWLTQDPGKGDQFNNKLLNGKTTEVIDILTKGMASGLSSPSRPWFKLSTTDPDLKQFHAVKVWLGLVERAMADLFQSTNFYTAANSGYRELALYGIEAAVMTQHWKHGAVVHPLTAGEFWIGISDALTPDSLYRRVPMTVAMAVQKFGDKVSQQVRTKYDQSNYDDWVPIFHAIEPNPERIPGKIDKTNMVYRSIYWEENNHDPGKEVLAFDGFEQQPFWAPRWDSGGSTLVYSRGPASTMLGSTKSLEIKELRLQQVEDYIARPALVGPPQLQTAVSNTNPGGKTYLAPSDMAQFKPIWEPNPQAPQIYLNDIERLERRIERIGYADLFRAITDMEGVQPRNDTEIGQRIEEKMQQLGPVVERVEKEKLRVAIDIAFSILMKNRMVPTPPPELHGQDLHIEFVSVLAQAQRAVGMGSIERVAGFTLNLARAVPDILDNVDFDGAVAEYSDLAGAPAKLMRSDEDKAAIRSSRAQQAKAAQMAAAAPAAKDGAQALKSVTEARVAAANANINPNIGAGSTRLEDILQAQTG